MKKLRLVFFAISLFLMNGARSQDFAGLLDGYNAYNRFWGSILIMENDSVLFCKSYGYADVADRIANSPVTLFNLLSVSKTMTAVAIMKLHDEGKLNVFDRVDKYFPGFINDDTKDVRIINLLNHTSGMEANIAQMDDQGRGMVHPGKEAITTDELIAKFRETKLKFQPGTKFEYNNYAYTLLGGIIEKVSGMSYPVYLEKVIFSPAGMSDTYYKTFLKEQPAIGYEGIGTGRATTVNDESHPIWLMGATDIYSSVKDLSKYLQAVFKNRILSDRTMHLMLDTCVQSSFPGVKWSLGWMVKNQDGMACYTHSGDGNGYATNISYIPSRNIIVVVLSNLVRGEITDGVRSTAFTFVDEISDYAVRLLDRQNVALLPVPTGKSDARICGKYKLDDSHLMNITLQNDSMFVNANSVTVFNYLYSRDTSDNSHNEGVCKALGNAFITGKFEGLEVNATEELQKAVFNKEEYSSLSGIWKYLTSTNGEYQSFSIYNIQDKQGALTYYMAYHFEKADLLMEVSFNEENLINGFFITSILSRCKAEKINIVAVGGDEYFIDGYRYGGFSDYRIRFDPKLKILTFSSSGDSFTAMKL